MSKNKKISSIEMTLLNELIPCASNRVEQREIKYTLLDAVEHVYGDDWFGLYAKTRKAIEEMCFLSADKGFFFMKADTIAKKFGTSIRTINKVLSVLQNGGLLYTAYLPAPKKKDGTRKHNGLGTPIHFFTNHPLFEKVCSILNIEFKAECKAECKAENDETPCESKDESQKKESTYSLPTHYHEKTIDIHSNVSQKENRQPVIKYVPKEINKGYAYTFGENLRSIWQKVTQAFKSVKQSIIDKKELLLIGNKVIKTLSLARKRKEGMSLDEMCRYAYKASVNALYSALATLYLNDMPIGENYALEGENERQSHMSKSNKIIRKEKVPQWLKDKQEREKMEQEKKDKNCDITENSTNSSFELDKAKLDYEEEARKLREELKQYKRKE